jgi:hypothetical protein
MITELNIYIAIALALTLLTFAVRLGISIYTST